MTLRHVSLFTGIGGIDLAAEWAGFETILMCEKDAFCRRVLAHHWPEVPVVEDIHQLTTAAVRDAAGGARIDLITGGFPCQPFSIAGAKRGKDDDRHLWPEMLRLIEEVRPTWVCGENVAHFIRMALDDVCADLEAAGYAVQPLVLPACGVGAWHRRERVFIIGHDADAESAEYTGAGGPRSRRSGLADGGGLGDSHLPDADRAGRGEQRRAEPVSAQPGKERPRGTGHAQSAMGRVADGLPDWVHGYWDAEPVGVPRVVPSFKGRGKQLGALGNAVVPAQIYPVLAAIAATYGET